MLRIWHTTIGYACFIIFTPVFELNVKGQCLVAYTKADINWESSVAERLRCVCVEMSKDHSSYYCKFIADSEEILKLGQYHYGVTTKLDGLFLVHSV